MGELIKKGGEVSFTTNILLKEEDGLFVAHCLELDIVATGVTMDQAQRDCVALVCAQVEYAFAHNNLDNLYHSAPTEVWAEFFACKAQDESRYKMERRLDDAGQDFVLPAWLVTKTCQSCHA